MVGGVKILSARAAVKVVQKGNGCGGASTAVSNGTVNASPVPEREEDTAREPSNLGGIY